MSLRAALCPVAALAATGCADPAAREAPSAPYLPAASNPFAQALYTSGFTGAALASREPGDFHSVAIGRGAIGKYQVRNSILPGRDMALALATKDGAFDFGDISPGSGALYQAVAAIACNAIASPATPR